MSNLSLIIEERAADIGNFMVGRLLPFRKKRSVGPFVFIDHMGPEEMDEHQNLDVGPHPHIGLSTLTYLFEGSILHRDSLGSEVEIQPGAVNWMTGGKGVVHSERTPEYLRGKKKSLHGLQIWVGLPKHLEEMEPQFHHIEAKDIPQWEEDEVNYKLIAGEAFQRKSPVPVHSQLYFVEISSSVEKKINIGNALYGEVALYILEGEIENDGHVYDARKILVAKNANLCEFTLKANAKVYIFGGEPFPEERYIAWNFVSSNQKRLEQAKQDWIDKKFPKVSGDDGYVPYPG